VLLGEQPGDKEDLDGRPFVGPAGAVLGRALQEANLPREQVYLTNAVKHFAFIKRGKHRLHRTPRYSEIIACRPWLESELEQLRPRLLVCLGASAAKVLFGPQFRLTEQRGKLLPSKFCDKTLVTYHPSAILRAESTAASERLYRFLVEDLRVAAELNQ
jgi:DNA polymerase